MATQPYLVVPTTLTVPDPSAHETDLATAGGHLWMVATMIEDDDLMFGGKPLSAWYEEDRRQSMGSEEGGLEEERRGRQREQRPRSEGRHHHHQYGHGYGHGHKCGKSKKEGKQ